MTSTARARTTHRPLHRRIGALAVAIVIEALLILALISLNNRMPSAPAGQPHLSVFDVAAPQASPEQHAASHPPAARPKPDQARPPTPTPIPPPAISLPTKQSALIPLSSAEMAAADISHLGSNGPPGTASAGDAQPVGKAPNGQPMYAAEWLREPTNTEVSGYLPKTMPDGGGSGLIACKTAEGFRVEDCVEIASDPPGSHLAGAVRQAAWQFRVRPPRVGGKPLIGVWVRIEIDYLSGKSD